MQTATRISRHHDIDGDCSICQHLLQGQPVARHPCGHAIHSDCYFDKVLAASTDASINADSCEVCRAEVCSKTRGDKDLTQHFASCKQLVASTAKRKGDESRGRLPREGPSLGSERAGAGADKRVEDPERPSKKKKVQGKKADKEGGGFTFANRGDVRRLGASVPAGDAHTCLPCASCRCYVAAHQACPPKHQAYFGDNQAIYL